MKLKRLSFLLLALTVQCFLQSGLATDEVGEGDIQGKAPSRQEPPQDHPSDDSQRGHPRRPKSDNHAAPPVRSRSGAVERDPPAAVADSDQCKRLDVDDDELVYSQLEAEDSNNDLLSKAYGLINSKLDGVTSMSIDYRGEGINRKVGKFTAKAVITRLSPSGKDVEQCYDIPYEIQDTDECNLAVGQPMRHKCHPSTICINTLGSYECGCAAAHWGEEGSGSPSLDKPIRSEEGECGGANTTEACCGRFGPLKERRAACLEDFKCTNDPCKGHLCDENAFCSPGEGYKDYECNCKSGFKKDERGDCVKDVRIEVNYCKNNTCPYHCRCAVEGSAYRCSPRPGYKEFIDENILPSDYHAGTPGGRRLDKITRCVDQRTPDISIKGANPMIYKQGDSYEELGVKVEDVNDDESERKIKIVFSKPPGAYLKHTGEFTVQYVLENRLLGGDGKISKSRKVKVMDVDECTYDGPHAEFRHACSREAECINTDGSYECLCAAGYSGDGMTTGSGCTDVTPPIITCVGEGCQTSSFRACNCVGMVSEDGSRRHLPGVLDDATISQYLKLLKADVCGYSEPPSEAGDQQQENDKQVAADDRDWKPEACFMAIDVEYGGNLVDLTSNITRGPLEKSPGLESMWRVPHYVKDTAGNSANVFYYNIKVEEVDAYNAISGMAAGMKRESFERKLLGSAVAALLVLLLYPIVWKFLLFVRTVLAAAKVVFFPYSMVGSREDFKLGYGFLLRVKAMGMGSSIDRERKIAAYWARLMDEASTYDDDREYDD